MWDSDVHKVPSRRVPKRGANMFTESVSVGQRHSQGAPTWGSDDHKAPQRGAKTFTKHPSVGQKMYTEKMYTEQCCH